jgi:ferredoxin/flavodoxin
MILYFSGTGNSRHIAQLLGQQLHDEVADIANLAPSPFTLPAAEALGIVFPVYGWSPPALVMQFIERMQAVQTPSYFYFIAVCGDDTGKTADVFAQAIRRKGWRVDAGWSVTMPNTYVCLPGFDVDKPGVEKLKVESAPGRINFIAESVRTHTATPRFDCHEGAFPWIKTYVLGSFFRKFLMKADKFHCTADCVGCGKCAKACPLGNIRMHDGHPEWGTYCAHCLRCYHLCPVHAVDYALRTLGKGQYKRFLKEK